MHSSDGPSLSLGRRPRMYPRESHSSNQIYRRDETEPQADALLGTPRRNQRRTMQHLQDLSSMLDGNDSPELLARIPSIDAFLRSSYSPTEKEAEESQPRTKRRRLDLGDEGVEFPKYGYHGQVVSGPLKMRMISCDGGQCREDARGLHRPENVLRNDKSVYCSDKGFCNILLCHTGETLFTLEKLTIRSPDLGYTSP
jgi:hypothetical protein